VRPSARLSSGKTNVNTGRTERARVANLAYAIIEQVFVDLHDPDWRADAEAFFHADHAAHRSWCCGVLDLPEASLWDLYRRAQARLLAAGPITLRPTEAVEGSGVS
jgi:hypothetical protein